MESSEIVRRPAARAAADSDSRLHRPVARAAADSDSRLRRPAACAAANSDSRLRSLRHRHNISKEKSLFNATNAGMREGTSGD